MLKMLCGISRARVGDLSCPVTSARRWPGLGIPRALSCAPRPYTKNAGHFSRQAPHAVFAAPPLTCTPSAHRRKVGGQYRGHVLRPARCYALCGLSVNPATLIVRGTQRQAARGRAGIPTAALADSGRVGTGHRRITARVMRSFGRRLGRTLPFPAHPRVASRPKSPARVMASLMRGRSEIAIRRRPPQRSLREGTGPACRSRVAGVSSLWQEKHWNTGRGIIE